MIFSLLPIQTPVTLDVRATSLALALPRLGAAYGVRMRAAPAIGDEIVILSLRGVALDDLKARLAATFAAEWSIDGNGTLTLNRSARLRNAEERAYFARREKGAGNLLDGLRREATAAPPITPELMETYRRAMEEATRAGKEAVPPTGPTPIMPGRRLLAGIVAGLRPADLTGLASRIVYSSAPTPMQRAFPIAVAPLVAAYEREQALVRRFSEEANVSDDSPGSRAPIATLLLVIESDLGNVTVSMGGFDAAGRTTVEESEELGFFTGDGLVQAERTTGGGARAAMGGVADEPATHDAEEHVFPLSEESWAYSDALGTGSIFASVAQLAKSRDRVRPFLDPVARDPLSYTLSDVAIEAARWTGRSVIVRPGDDQIVSADMVKAGTPVTLSDALVTKIDRSAPGWLVAKPEYPYEIGLVFFPRPALRDALGLAFADGRLTIGTATRIAALAPETGVEPILLAFPMRLAFGRTYLYLPALRVLAAMGENGRQRAAAGTRFGDLAAGVRRRLSALVFGPSALAIRLKEVQPGFANPPGATDLEAEPTSLLPNGIPSDARVTVTTTSADGVIPVDLALQNGRTFAPDLLAQRIFENRNPRLFAPGVVQQAARWSVARLRRAGRETTTLRVDLTPRHMLSFSHQSYDAASGPEFTMASLPPDLRAAVDRAMTGVEARYRDAKPYEAEPSGEAPPP